VVDARHVAGAWAVVSLVDLNVDVKPYLNIGATDTTRDSELAGFISGATDLIEYETGPVASRVVSGEQHSGGGTVVALRQLPVASVLSVVEYQGTLAQPLTQAASPGVAGAYSFTLEPETGTLTRRGSYGALSEWFAGRNNIVVSYQSGYTTIPAGIRMATLEVIRLMYQQTQQGATGLRPAGSMHSDGDAPTSTGPAGFVLPYRVMQWLQPFARLPGIG